MWECGSWHDSILLGDRVYYLQDLPEQLKLEQSPDLYLQRCAQVSRDLYLLVYQSEPGVETYCYFKPDFEVVAEEKRVIPPLD